MWIKLGKNPTIHENSKISFINYQSKRTFSLHKDLMYSDHWQNQATL